MSDEVDTAAAEAAESDRFEELVGEDLVISNVEADTLSLNTSAVGMANVGDAQVTGSAAGAIIAKHDVSLSMVAAGAVGAQGDLTIDRGGSGVILAGGNVSIHQGGAETILCGGAVSIDGGGAGIVAAREIAIKDGWVGVVAGSNVEIAEGVEVMFGPREAIFLGAAFGVCFGIVCGLFAMFRGGRDED